MMSLVFAPLFAGAEPWDNWWQALIVGVVFTLFLLLWQWYLNRHHRQHEYDIAPVQRKVSAYVVRRSDDEEWSGGDEEIESGGHRRVRHRSARNGLNSRGGGGGGTSDSPSFSHRSAGGAGSGSPLS